MWALQGKYVMGANVAGSFVFDQKTRLFDRRERFDISSFVDQRVRDEY